MLCTTALTTRPIYITLSVRPLLPTYQRHYHYSRVTPRPLSREQLLHHLHHGVDLGLDAEELLADGAAQQHAHHVVELA